MAYRLNKLAGYVRGWPETVKIGKIPPGMPGPMKALLQRR